jgi:hypothetical protein
MRMPIISHHDDDRQLPDASWTQKGWWPQSSWLRTAMLYMSAAEHETQRVTTVHETAVRACPALHLVNAAGRGRVTLLA